MGNAGQFGQQFLDLSRRVRPARRCRRLSPLHRPDARRAALLCREYRQHARRARPRLHPARRHARWPRQVDRSLYRRARRQCLLRRLQADALDHFRRRSGQAARRGQGGNRASGNPRLSRPADLLPRHLCSRRAQVRRRARPARWRCLLPRRGARIYHAAFVARGHPPAGPEGSGAHRRRHEEDHGRGRVQGQLRRLPQVPPHRSAVHRPQRPTI